MSLQLQKKWLSLQKRMQRNDLTLGQLKSLEDEALLLLTDPEDILGNEIISSIQDKRDGICNSLIFNNITNDSDFSCLEPIAHEFDRKSIESTFSSRLKKVASMIRRQNSLKPYKENLSKAQQREIAEIAGESASPEILAHAINAYVGRLREQIKVAETFYFGRMRAGMEGLSRLSEKVRQRVDEMVWQASGGNDVSPELVIAALMQSVEEQMGMHEEVG